MRPPLVTQRALVVGLLDARQGAAADRRSERLSEIRHRARRLTAQGADLVELEVGAGAGAEAEAEAEVGVDVGARSDAGRSSSRCEPPQAAPAEEDSDWVAAAVRAVMDLGEVPVALHAAGAGDAASALVHGVAMVHYDGGVDLALAAALVESCAVLLVAEDRAEAWRQAGVADHRLAVEPLRSTAAADGADGADGADDPGSGRDQLAAVRRQRAQGRLACFTISRVPCGPSGPDPRGLDSGHRRASQPAAGAADVALCAAAICAGARMIRTSRPAVARRVCDVLAAVQAAR